MMALRILCGIGKGMTVAAIFSTIALAPNPTRAFALTNGAYAALGAFYFLLIPKQIEALGAGGAFLVIFIVSALGLLLLPLMPRVKASPQPMMEDLRALANPTGLIVLAGLAGVMLGHGVIWMFMQLIGTSAGLSLQAVGTVLALAMAVTVAGPATAHVLPTSLGITRPLACALVLKALLATILVMSLGPAVFWVTAPAFNILSLFIVPFVMGLLSRIDTTGRLAASGSAAMTLGGSLGSLIGGLTTEHIGFGALGVVACVAFGLSAFALLPTSRLYDRQPRPETSGNPQPTAS